MLRRLLLVALAGPCLAGCGEQRRHPEPLPATASVPPGEPAPPVQARVRASGQLGPGRGTLWLRLEPPPGGKLTEGSPLTVTGGGGGVRLVRRISEPLRARSLPLSIPVDVDDGALGPVRLDVGYYWCGEGHHAACRPARVELTVELDLHGPAAGGEAQVAHRTPAG